MYLFHTVKHINIHDLYNIRGWLKAINQDQKNDNDLFNFGISYNTVTHGGTPLYNGNIAETQWQTANTDNSQKWYRYAYDPLNRITAATGGANTNFDVTGITYDKNGNISNLNRRGNDARTPASTNYGVIDQLNYQYGPGNKLLTVTDSAPAAFAPEGFKDNNKTSNDYTYDANGNMTRDLNKGIGTTATEGITYNHLNLPVSVKINNGSANNGTINYIYAATGVKLQKNVLKNGSRTSITEYAGNYVYENGTLKQFNHSEGYVEPDENNWQYVYRYTDIWGNTRITYADDNNNGTIETGSQYSEIRREQNYYPFGLEHKGYNYVTRGVKNNLKTYQKQEFTEDLGLNTHEWKYRISDPAIGRFWQVDPLAESYTYNSTYAFQENKMGMGIELEGLEVQRFKDGVKQVGNGVNRAYREATNVKREMNIKGANGSQTSELAQQQRISQYSIAAANVAHGTTEAVKGGAKVAGESVENVGDGITVIGFATAQPEIIAIGEGISTTGSLINAAIDLSDDKSTAAVGAEFAVSIAIGELGDQGVKATRKVAGSEFVKSGSNKLSETIILGSNKVLETVTKDAILPKFSPVIPPRQLDTRLVKDEKNQLN